MVRWIVNNVPPTVFLLILVTCICAATLGGLRFIRRRYPSLAEGKHANLFLVVELGYPYLGVFAPTPEPLHAVIKLVQNQPSQPMK